MSNKARDAYMRLSKALSELDGPPQCADIQYRDLFFVEPMPPGTPDALSMRMIRQNETDAKLICDFCKVKTECAEYALAAGEPWGIFGGTSPADRKAIYAFARASKTGEPVIELLGD